MDESLFDDLEPCKAETIVRQDSLPLRHVRRVSIPGAMAFDWMMRYPEIRIYRTGNCSCDGIGYQDVWKIPSDDPSQSHWYYVLSGFHLLPGECFESKDIAIVSANHILEKTIELWKYYATLNEYPTPEQPEYLRISKVTVLKFLKSFQDKVGKEWKFVDWNTASRRDMSWFEKLRSENKGE